MLRTRGPWLAAAIALAIFTPHIVWQLAHRVPTLEFMRNATADKLVPHTLGSFLRLEVDGMLWLATPIWLAGLAFYLWFDAGRDFRSLGWAWLAVFLLLVITRTSRAAYLAPAYSWLLPAGGVVLERVAGRSRIRQAAGWLYLVILLLAGYAAAPYTLPVLPEATIAARTSTAGGQRGEERYSSTALPEFLGHMDGWPEIVDSVARVFDSLPAGERAHAAILAPDYGIAGAIDLFGRRRGLPASISAHNNYWFWDFAASSRRPSSSSATRLRNSRGGSRISNEPARPAAATAWRTTIISRSGSRMACSCRSISGGASCRISSEAAASRVSRNPRSPAGLGEGEGDRADRRLLLERTHLTAGRDFHETTPELLRQPGHDAEYSAGEDEGKRVAAHFEARRHRARGQHQFLGGPLEDLRGDRVAAIARALHNRSECRDVAARHLPVVDNVDKAGRSAPRNARAHLR